MLESIQLSHFLCYTKIQSTNGADPTLIDDMKQTLEYAQSNLTTAQAKGCTTANKPRRTEEFAEGNEVMLSTRNL